MSGLRWSPERLAAHNTKMAAQSIKKHADPQAKFHAVGRLPKGTMNKTEAAYAQRLDAMKVTGEVIDYRFHPMRIRLAANTYYEVDFLVLRADMCLEIHETKGGFTTEKGQLKIKLVAEVMPWFRMLKVTGKRRGQIYEWTVEEFND